MAGSKKGKMPDDRSDLRQRADEVLKQYGELDKIPPADLICIHGRSPSFAFSACVPPSRHTTALRVAPVPASTLRRIAII